MRLNLCCVFLKLFEGHTLSVRPRLYTHLYTTPSFLLYFFSVHFPVQEGPYINVYNTSGPTVINFFPLFRSLSSGVPSGCPEHMCFGLPRVEPYLGPGWEQTAGFVCGTINQLSFNKNRKPDERQREETWGVGPCLGGKKRQRGKERRGERGEGGYLTQIQAFNKSSSNNNKQSFHVARLINQVFFPRHGKRGSFSLSCLLGDCKVVERGSFYIGRQCLYAARFWTWRPASFMVWSEQDLRSKVRWDHFT